MESTRLCFRFNARFTRRLLFFFSHTPAISPTRITKSTRATNAAPKRKTFRRKSNGFSCFRSFRNTFQRKIESKSFGSISKSRGAFFIKLDSLRIENSSPFASLLPAADFLLTHADFLNFEVYPAEYFWSCRKSRAKNRLFAPRFGRVKRGSRRSIWKLISRVNYSRDLMSPGEKNFGKRENLFTVNLRLANFCTIGAFLHQAQRKGSNLSR